MLAPGKALSRALTLVPAWTRFRKGIECQKGIHGMVREGGVRCDPSALSDIWLE
jgi:hypothetical protein